MIGFVFRLIAPRADFALTMSELERAMMGEHFGYWSALADKGNVLAFAPVNDRGGPYGIGIVLAEDLVSARGLAKSGSSHGPSDRVPHRDRPHGPARDAWGQLRRREADGPFPGTSPQS